MEASDAIRSSAAGVALVRTWRHACSFDAVVLAAHEPADGHAERSCQIRQDPLVGGFAGFQALDRAREDAGGPALGPELSRIPVRKEPSKFAPPHLLENSDDLSLLQGLSA